MHLGRGHACALEGGPSPSQSVQSFQELGRSFLPDQHRLQGSALSSESEVALIGTEKKKEQKAAETARLYSKGCHKEVLTFGSGSETLHTT